MRLTTFNIRYDRGADGWFDADDPRSARVLTVLREANADIIGLQEVLAAQLADLEVGLPGYTRVGVGRDDGEAGGEFAPLFIRDAAFAIEDSGTFWLSATPDTPGTTWPPARLARIATWARLVEHDNDRRQLLVINTHWDHEARSARVASARQIVDFVGDAPAVVMGDLNALALSIPLRRLRAAGFVDTWGALFPLRVAAATFHDWTGRALGPRIDYILHRGPLSTVSAGIERVEFAGGWASDHHPAHAVLRWKLG